MSRAVTGIAWALALAAAGAASADEVLTLTHQAIARTAIVHRPPMSETRPRPLVVALAGRDASTRSAAASFQRWAGFDAVADREGFVVAYPEPIDATWNYGRSLSWPVPVIGDAAVDDVGFIGKLVDELVARRIADPARTYVAGTSRGGLLTFTLACVMSERFAAAAAFITGMTESQRAECRPARSVPMMVVAGTSDSVQIYDGWLHPPGRLLSVPETMEFWRTLHGCTGQTATALPHREASDPTRVLLIEWTGCRAPAAVRLYRVAGGGHHMPSLAPGEERQNGRRNRDIETAEEVWTFVKSFAR